MQTLTADSLVARAILAANRPVRSGGAPAQPEQMARSEALGAWYDTHHAFLVAIGCVSIRAVTDQGRFCWLVRETGAKDVLSYVKSPYDVVPARGGDGGLGIPHAAVTELAASLRRGGNRIRLAGRDFRAAGRPLQLLAARAMPGRLATWLLPLLPPQGSAIWHGARRTA